MVNRPAKARREYDTNRRALLRVAKANNMPCALGNHPINYEASQYDPLSFTADHIVPWAISHDDTLANLQPACRWCNSSKGKGPTPRRNPMPQIKTSRDW